MTNDKYSIEQIIMIVLAILSIILFFILCWRVVELYKTTHNDCMINIAKNYCSEQGMIYTDINSLNFHCYNNERTDEYKEFRFLEKDYKECELK